MVDEQTLALEEQKKKLEELNNLYNEYANKILYREPTLAQSFVQTAQVLTSIGSVLNSINGLYDT